MLQCVIGLLILIALILAGVPIAFAFSVGALFMIFTLGYDPAFLLPYSFRRLDSLVLMCMPFFILAGNIMEKGGITEPLVDFVGALISRVRGGLGAIGVITNAIFGAISGSSFAAISCIGPIMIPPMEREGYPRGYATSLMTSAAGIANLIPPSILLILYGWLSDTSVTACFLAGMLPGILLMAIFIVINWIMVGKMPVTKERRPQSSIRQIGRQVAHTGWRAFPALTMPVFVLGTIYGGIATPTEAAAASIFYAALLGFLVYRKLTPRSFVSALVEGGGTVGSIMVMLFFAMMLGRIFVMERIPDQVAALMLGISQNKYVVLLMCNIIIIIFGMFIDDTSCMIISACLLVPVGIEIGVNPVHLSVILTTNIMMGCYTPPMAPMLYIGQRVGKTTFPEMFRTSMMLVVCGYLPTLLLVTYWPPLSLWLPKLVLGAKVLGLS